MLKGLFENADKFRGTNKKLNEKYNFENISCIHTIYVIS